MGIVYAALDDRLGRVVAVKTMSSLAGDEIARKRFWREARAAASVNHPNICHLYEIGEDRGELFIAMELLDGEALADRLKCGPLPVSDSVRIALGMLAALAALHSRGVVHRDLKPSNVFLTPHGVKLLDFGLARPIDPELQKSLGSGSDLTQSGMIVGTPRYMAPEQLTGAVVDARSDLFAAGAILFEMLAGRPAFEGRSAVEILHATLYEQPPALTGSPAVSAADRIIRRALSKHPSERPASADAMAEELRAAQGLEGSDAAVLARALTRLVVLPFRILRSDPETDFLAFSLPDAIATSLSGIGSLVVRSSATAARFGAEVPDLKALAAEADVDRVVMGTLVRSGDQLRATAQLVEAPGGTLLRSHTVQSSMGDLFGLQDEIARRVVDALALPLTGLEESPTPAAPHDASAYGFYLRANEFARTYDNLLHARDQYARCVELDPGFAPAWARLGRCHWVIGKYVERSADSAARAEEALRRALELEPRLSVAHKYYASLEADTGQALAALRRLLGQAARHGNDPELFAGLVHACRYCGLYERSIAAHEEAHRLDPNVRTSLELTLLMAGKIEGLQASERPAALTGVDAAVRVIRLGLAGRNDDARRALHNLQQAERHPSFKAWADYLGAWLDRRSEDMARIATGGSLDFMDDPEATFHQGWMLCGAGDGVRGLVLVRRAVAKGYWAASTLADARQFDALRGDPTFGQLLAEAQAGRERAAVAFSEAGGERLLGL